MFVSSGADFEHQTAIVWINCDMILVIRGQHLPHCTWHHVSLPQWVSRWLTVPATHIDLKQGLDSPTWTVNSSGSRWESNRVEDFVSASSADAWTSGIVFILIISSPGTPNTSLSNWQMHRNLMAKFTWLFLQILVPILFKKNPQMCRRYLDIIEYYSEAPWVWKLL